MENRFGDFTLKIPLFAGAEVLVKKNQEVEESQVVAKVEQGEGKQLIEIKSPVGAKAIDLEKNFLVLRFPALVFSAKAGFGTSGWGKLKVFSGHLFELKEVEGKIVLMDNLTLAVFNKLEALEASGAVCQQAEGGIEKEIDEAGVLILSEKDFRKACQHNGKRAKMDVGDKRLIIAK